MERQNLHKIFQDTLEDNENLRDLSGKIITGKAREHHQVIRADFICHTKGDIEEEEKKPGIRPFSHFKKRNTIEFKTLHQVVNKNIFRYYIGRALCAENCDDIKYDGETTLTIVTTRKPLSLLKMKKYKFEEIAPWKYQSHYDDNELEIYIIILREMRGIKGGEGMALLQVFEGDVKKQILYWEKLLNQDLKNSEKLKKIMETINEEIFMNILKQAETR